MNHACFTTVLHDFLRKNSLSLPSYEIQSKKDIKVTKCYTITLFFGNCEVTYASLHKDLVKHDAARSRFWIKERLTSLSAARIQSRIWM